MATSPIQFKPKECPLPGSCEYTIGTKNTGSSAEPYPDQALLQWSAGGLQPATIDLDGCPPNLPPGQACAFKVNFTDDLWRAQTGDSFDKIVLIWSSGDFDSVELSVDECGL